MLPWTNNLLNNYWWWCQDSSQNVLRNKNKNYIIPATHHSVYVYPRVLKYTKKDISLIQKRKFLPEILKKRKRIYLIIYSEISSLFWKVL